MPGEKVTSGRLHFLFPASRFKCSSTATVSVCVCVFFQVQGLDIYRQALLSCLSFARGGEEGKVCVVVGQSRELWSVWGRGRGGGGYKHEKEGYRTVNCFGNHWHISGPRITFWSEWWSLGQNQLKTPGLQCRKVAHARCARLPSGSD